ncbi:hypothetical protein EMCRGX_G012061 [Ephydatia muelleri]
MDIAGIDPKTVNSNSTINVTINGNNTSLNKTSIVCNCYSSTENIPTPTFVTTILIYDPPSPPTNLTVTEIVGARVSISWSAPFAPSGVALWYRVRIADLSSTQIPTLYLSNATHYETSHLNCLQCEITVVAANEAGESVLSDFVLFNRTTTANETGESVPSDSVLFNRTASAVPLLVCVVVVPVGGLVIVVIIAIAIVAVVRRKRTRRLKLQAPCPAGQTATQRDPRDTPVSLNAYQTPHA